MNDTSPPIPEFATERLRLRPLTPEDAPGLHQAYGDAEAMRFWDAPPSQDIAETERRIGRSLAVDSMWHAVWAVLRRADNGFVGMVNYHGRQPWNRRLVLGWILVPACQGAGFMQEALRPLLAHCFGTLETHRVEAEIEEENRRSLRLAARLGFRREALLRDRLFVAGQPRSAWMHALLRPEWAGLEQARLE